MDIDECDLRIDTFRNTTESAVRITHLPTGIVTSRTGSCAACNKAAAMAALRNTLHLLERNGS